jgi:SMODS-associated and fused to various effectors sensor domain
LVKEVTRYIKRETERELWARAAGRCEFDGCNTLLYKSSITQETVNLAQQAHIYAFSDKGPRGWGPFKINLTGLNDVSNLMLMCHGCHKKIDQDLSGIRYSADLLISWKIKHEDRVLIVTGIKPDKKSHVVLYGANIGSEKSSINYHNCVEAMFPNTYPANERPVMLSMTSSLKDSSRHYWDAESSNLFNIYTQKITTLIEQDSCKSFSVFALAPQPLLIQLGTLLTDKTLVETYQLHREPPGWLWINGPENFDFEINRPDSFDGPAVLLVSLSDSVSRDRVTSVLGDKASIWTLAIQNPNNDFMKSKEQLSLFRKSLRMLMVEIKAKHGNLTPLHIFPVMPVSCAIELGRIRMPKADMPWIIYDQDFATKIFVKSLEL